MLKKVHSRISIAMIIICLLVVALQGSLIFINMNSVLDSELEELVSSTNCR